MIIRYVDGEAFGVGREEFDSDGWVLATRNEESGSTEPGGKNGCKIYLKS
jgi:hypothetical protein